VYKVTIDKQGWKSRPPGLANVVVSMNVDRRKHMVGQLRSKVVLWLLECVGLDVLTLKKVRLLSFTK
jgi:hypothetical protein